jgi:hypothetical protein
MNFINLTPHDIVVKRQDGEFVTFPKSGKVARVKVRTQTIDVFNGIAINNNTYGDVEDLPKRDKYHNNIYIVPRMVRDFCPDRTDLVSPGDLIRDDKGNPVACDGLVV